MVGYFRVNIFMKIIFLCLGFLILNISSAQSNFDNQLERILIDSPNGFLQCKGNAKVTIDTTILEFNTVENLEGTKDNFIMIHKLLNMYSALIEDSTTKKSGKRILSEWKTKLISVLGNSYSINQMEFRKENIRSREGWNFTKDNLFLDLILSQSPNDKSLYLIGLLISYEHPK